MNDELNSAALQAELGEIHKEITALQFELTTILQDIDDVPAAARQKLRAAAKRAANVSNTLQSVSRTAATRNSLRSHPVEGDCPF